MVQQVELYQNCISNPTFVIPNAGTTSNAIRINGLLPVGLRFPAAFTGATVALEESVDGTTWTPIRINGDSGDFSVAVTVSKTVVFSNAVPLVGFLNLRIRSGSNEAAERSVGLICRPI